MLKPKKRIFKSKMHFDKEELAGRVNLGASGISMPYLSEDALDEYRKDFSRQRDSLNFGMLGNDPKYYAGENRSSIVPKPEDYVEVPFRLISATIVGGGSWKATDFSDAKILKKSTPLLDGVPLYKDHETDLDNWSGLINGVKWTTAFTNSDGIEVPAGIDGIVAIDTVVDPKLARGVISGAVYSNSVTVEFDWEMSHEFENEWDFLNKIGSLGSDGKMIRRIVKAIHNYHESSLVWLGADPFAKAIDVDGNHKNIDVSSIYDFAKVSFSKSTKVDLSKEDALPENVEAARSLTINFAVDKNVLSLARRTKTNFKNNTKDMKEFIAAFIATFGKQFNLVEGAEPTTAEMVGYMKQLSFVSAEDSQKTLAQLATLKTVETKALEAFKTVEGNEDAETVDMTAFLGEFAFVPTASHTALTKSVTDLTADKKALETKVTELTANAEIGEKYIGMQRAEAIRLYKVAVGEDKVDASVIAMFEKAEADAVEGLLKQYTKDATVKFSGKCAKCDSTEFNFRSSIGGQGVEGQETIELVEVPTTQAIHAKRNQSSMHIGRIKDEQKED